MAQNSNVARSQEDYITQVSKEIESRVTKKLSQEFSRTENRILGALSRLDDFLLNPLFPGHSGTAPETSRNGYSSNQGTNEDDSQSGPHPDAGVFESQTTHNSGPEYSTIFIFKVFSQRFESCVFFFKILFLAYVFSNHCYWQKISTQFLYTRCCLNSIRFAE